jgi:hypothetical protein
LIVWQRRQGYFASVCSNQSTMKIISIENLRWNDRRAEHTSEAYTISCDRREAKKEFCYDQDASQNGSQIVCGFDRHIDRVACARDPDGAP